MAKYTEINEAYQRKQQRLFAECHVFWAFSDEQFKEGKAKYPLQEGEKYVSIGMGGYLPKSNLARLKEGLRELDTWKKQAMIEVKAEEAILYELNNHECFYVGDYSGALDVLNDAGYTTDQVRQVYKKYQTSEGYPRTTHDDTTCTKYNETVLPDEQGYCSLCGAVLTSTEE